MDEVRKPSPAQGLSLQSLRKSYGAVEAVKGIDVAVPAGTMTSLIGPSGCGKTTTLRMIAGLDLPSGGRIVAGDTILSGEGRAVPPERREMGMVFQTYALWPHMSVAENVGYGLRRRGMGKADTRDRVARVLGMVNMAGFADRYPGQLSGGQQQRVALARAIAPEPRILLFDEPLSNLDAVLREQMRFEIRRLQQELGITSVYVTHSQEEAFALSDQVVIMRDGRIVQAGRPETLYDRPRTAFVAGFIGPTNILPLTGVVSEGSGIAGRMPGGHVLRLDRGAVRDGQVSLRPSDLRIADGAGPNRIPGRVASVVFSGGLVDVFVTVDGAADTTLRMQSLPPALVKAGDRVVLSADAARMVALDEEDPE